MTRMDVLHLFVASFLAWSVGLAGVAIAFLVRNRSVGFAAAIAAGALFGLLGPDLELLDLYLSVVGWESVDALTLLAVALSALACLLWWVIGRLARALVLRPRQPAVS
jgi:hypothetical protein